MTSQPEPSAAGDPTFGRIDPDIVRAIDECEPESLAQRVAMENTLQARRNERGRDDADGPFVAFWPGCCRHLRMDHDQHGCTIDVSADRRCYYRCHDDEQPALDPRWRDHHTLPDEWLYRVLTKRRKGGWRAWIKRVPWLWKASSRYALRHFHCHKDGRCIFRAGHRGSCYWGADDDD